MVNVFYSYIVNLLKKFILKISINDHYINIKLRNYKDVNFILNFLRLHTCLYYKVLIDIACVDFLNIKSKRFEVNYILSSILNKSRLIVSISVAETDIIQSSLNLYSSSNWLEREV
jgi:NADH:ubiquinone oxidoreductase subunit C